MPSSAWSMTLGRKYYATAVLLNWRASAWAIKTSGFWIVYGKPQFAIDLLHRSGPAKSIQSQRSVAGIFWQVLGRTNYNEQRDSGNMATSVTNGACVIKSALIPYTQHLTLFMLLKSIMHMSGDPMGLNELQNHCPPRGPYHRGRFSSSSKLHPDACK